MDAAGATAVLSHGDWSHHAGIEWVPLMGLCGSLAQMAVASTWVGGPCPLGAPRGTRGNPPQGTTADRLPVLRPDGPLCL